MKISSLSQLEGFNQKQLDALFRKGNAKDFPNGDTDGKVLLQPFLIKFLGEVIWQGKTFDLKKMRLSNRFLGLHFIYGKLKKGKSLFDKKSVLLIDYRGSSKIAGDVVDELREVGKGIFLGRAYKKGRFFASFALSERK